eukprot:g48261.t1
MAAKEESVTTGRSSPKGLEPCLNWVQRLTDSKQTHHRGLARFENRTQGSCSQNLIICRWKLRWGLRTVSSIAAKKWTPASLLAWCHCW